MKLIVAGTPEFAAVILRGLIATDHRIVAVYTQPDRAAGRGRRLRASAVKAVALEHDIDVAQPLSLRDPHTQQAIAEHAPDAMIVAAYGLILPPAVLQIPRLGCINVHASLLPRWRGAAPIQRAIEAGDSQTGVCIMQMDKGLDTGPVLASRSFDIGPGDTAGVVHDRLAVLGRDLLIESLGPLAEGRLKAQVQDESLATYAHRFDKNDARLDWQRDAQSLERQVRAFNPVPGAWTEIAGKGDPQRLRILRASIVALDATPRPPPGTVIRAEAGELAVACGDAALRLEQVQSAGKRAMAIADFLNARSLLAGDLLR